MPAVVLSRRGVPAWNSQSWKRHGKISRRNKSPTFLTSFVTERGRKRMETGPWINRERAIWKMLPLRPPPKVLESQTSYLTRLAEANGFQSINEVGALAGGMNFSKRPDYPATAYSGLAQITGIPEAEWFERTFFYLIQHFGC